MSPILIIILLVLVVLIFVNHYQNNSVNDLPKSNVKIDNIPKPSEIEKVVEPSKFPKLLKITLIILTILLLLLGTIIAFIYL